MMIKKLVTFEDLGFVQWGVLNEAEDGVYGAIALEEAFFTPLPETMLEFIRQGNDGLLALAENMPDGGAVHPGRCAGTERKDGRRQGQTARYDTHHGPYPPYGTEYFLYRQKLYGTHCRI